MSENKGIMPVSLADRDLYREQWVDKTVEEIKKHKYLNPLYDAAFKAFLSDEQALKSFLNGVFEDDRNKIESVVIKNPEINMIFPVVKQKLYRGDWAVRNEESFTPHANPLRSYLRKKDDNVQLESSVCRAASVPGLSLAPAYGVQFIPEPDVIEVEFVRKSLANGNSGGTTTIKGRKLNGNLAAKGVYYGKKVLIK